MNVAKVSRVVAVCIIENIEKELPRRISTV